MHPTYVAGGGYNRWRVSVQQSRCRAIARDLEGSVFEAAASRLAAEAEATSEHARALACAQRALILWRAAGIEDREVIL